MSVSSKATKAMNSTGLEGFGLGGLGLGYRGLRVKSDGFSVQGRTLPKAKTQAQIRRLTLQLDSCLIITPALFVSKVLWGTLSAKPLVFAIPCCFLVGDSVS